MGQRVQDLVMAKANDLCGRLFWIISLFLSSCGGSPYAEWDTPVEIEVEGGLAHRYPSPDSLPAFALSGEAFSPFGIYEMSYRLDERFPEKLAVQRDTTQAEAPVSFSISLKTKPLKGEKHQLHISGIDSSGNVQTLTVQLAPYR